MTDAEPEIFNVRLMLGKSEEREERYCHFGLFQWTWRG